MSSLELSEWQAFYNLEPWGDERADLRSGLAASALCNLWTAKGSHRYKASDFLMNFEETEPQTPDQMKAMLQALTTARKNRPTTKKAKKPSSGQGGSEKTGP
jgi:hypothetical protein